MADDRRCQRAPDRPGSAARSRWPRRYRVPARSWRWRRQRRFCWRSRSCRPDSGVKLARAVPFALEEQLTEDIDQLSFAIGRRRSSGGTPVAAVSRTVLQGWLSRAECRRARAAGHVPGHFADAGESRANRAVAGEVAARGAPSRRAAIRRGTLAGERSAGGRRRHCRSSRHGRRSPRSRKTRFSTSPATIGRTSQDEFEQLVGKFESLKVQLLPDGAAALACALARNHRRRQSCCRGSSRAPPTLRARWRQWRTAAVLAAGLLLVHVAAQALQIRHAKHESAALDGQIGQRVCVRHARRSHPGSAPPDAVAARSHPQAGREPGIFFARPEDLERRLAVAPKTDDRCA